MNKYIILMVIGLLGSTYAIADSRMVIDNEDGTMTIWSNNKYFRGKMSNIKPSEDSSMMEQGDLFGDIRSKKTYMIVDKEKILIDLAQPFGGMPNFLNLPHMPKPEKVKISYNNKGAGETIAGFKTTKYQVIASGQKCFEVLLTKDAVYGAVIKKFNSLSKNEGNSLSRCEQAENLMDQTDKYGYIVKLTDASGLVTMTLKDFKSNVKAPTKYLAFPRGYKVMTMMEVMSKAMSEGKLNFSQPK